MESLIDGVQVPTALDEQLRSGAVIVQRDGQPVVGNYGSAAAEVALCHKSVGLAVRSDLRTLEVHGQEAWLEALLERNLGGDVPAPDAVRSIGGTHCARVNERTVLLVGRPAVLASWVRAARQAIVSGSPLDVVDGPPAQVPVSLIGPKVSAVLESADLPAIPLGVAGVCARAGAHGLTLVGAGPDHVLVVAHRPTSLLCQSLLAAGRAVGLSLVGAEAVAMLSAARSRRL